MSYQSLQDAIHRAMITDPPVVPPSPTLTQCRECYGVDPCCPDCHGCGWLRP